MEPALHVLSPRPPGESLELTPGGRSMARTLGWLLLSGSSLVLVWLVLPHTGRATEGAIVAIVLVAWALGALLLGGSVYDRSPSFFAGVIGVAVLLVSAAVFFTRSPTSQLSFLYLWFVPVAYAFFPLRRAVLLTAAMAVSLAVALLLQIADDPDLRASSDVAFGLWLMSVAAVVVTGTVVRRVVTARRASLDRLARGFADASIGMAVVSADWRWIEVNDALCRLVARPREELVGRTPSDITHPEDIGVSRAVVDRALHERQRAQNFVKRYLRPDGEVVWASIDTLRFERRGGEPFLFCLIRDITAQQRAHDSLARRAAEQSAVARLGRFALGEQDLGALMEEVASVVGRTLEIEHCVVLELEPGREAVRVVAGVGIREGFVFGQTVDLFEAYCSGQASGERRGGEGDGNQQQATAAYGVCGGAD